jgi:outer membrane protein
MKRVSPAIAIACIFFVFTSSGVRAQSNAFLAIHPVAAHSQMGSATQPALSTSPQSIAETPQVLTPPSGPTLTLSGAENHALKHQPRLMAQILRERAANKIVAENQSTYFPQLVGNLTAVQANGDTTQAAGAVTTSSVSTRAAGGLTLLQLITDFGRTHDLVRSARFSANASGQSTESIRQQVLRDVDEAYFAVEAAESVQKTAQAVLSFRRVSLRQLNALAQNQLRSTLDVQFAQVLVSQAELAVVHANSTVEETRAQLTAAMGDESNVDYVLIDQPLPPGVENDVNAYVTEALQNRPDLNALKLQAKSAHQFALAEKKLNYPTLNVVGTAGEIPTQDSTLSHDYGAVGLNLSVPVFNGGLYTERAAEAKFRAQAQDRDVTDLSISIARDVRMAWAQAEDAFLEIQVAQRLVDQTNVALRLAQDRYNIGLGSIVELNEAELNQTSALITAATARFDYQRTRTALNYTLGIVH